ncbi:MAG: porin family protein [Chlorobiaceae bacterium]|nr:porin family protein [Chlorobiaceae bacterium]
MKKIIATFLTIVTIGSLTTSALAAQPYISGGAGATWFNEIKSTPPQMVAAGLNLNAAVGLASGNYRAEVEYGGQGNIDWLASFMFGEMNLLTTSSWMLNGYYDFSPDEGWLRPYVTAGAGLANVGIHNWSLWSNETYTADHTVFAYEAGVGALVPLVANFDLDLRYRYFATDKLHDTRLGSFDIASQSLMCGLLYRF